MLGVGTWLSLVEHSVRDAGVAGSNPVVPTISEQAFDVRRRESELLNPIGV
jgi:hypothetical protein